MQGRGKQKQEQTAPQNSSYETLKIALCAWLQTLGYAEGTIKAYKKRLTTFLNWLTLHNINELKTLSQDHLQHFLKYLETRKNQNTKTGGLSESYIYGHFTVLKLLNQYLQLTANQTILNGHIRLGRRISSTIEVLKKADILKLYAATENDIVGYRDRALLALHYGCGLRISEGINLETRDLYYKKGLIYVKAGKNYHSRYVPLSKAIKSDLASYEQYRNIYLQNENSTTAFLLGNQGKRLNASSINKRLKHLAKQAGLRQRIYAHLLRHSIATHLLQSGMDLESISQFLGHNSLEATEIYTHLLEDDPL
jgi:site-specific recombinase XerD